MIANDQFVATFGIVPSGDEDALVRIAVAAVRAGYAVVIDKPNQKIPMCTLTERGITIADKAARDEARAADDQQWAKRKHACGLKHAFTDDKKVRAAVDRLIKRHGSVNLGLELGGSRLVVVDVDTTEEKDSFLARWSVETGRNESGRLPTVSSPGVQETTTGEWKHKDGGHYWFTLPEGVELPAGSGALRTGEGPGYSVMWANHQVLVPPSSRPEGNYVLQGQVEQCPRWIIDMILMDVESRAARARMNINRVFDGENTIDQWSAKTPWAEILEEDGWVDTGLPDNCSCPIWTAPGVHSSPKSATAHDLGCSVYDTTIGHAPLHIWTDNPPEFLGLASSTITKLQYLAHRDHEGSIGHTLGALGLGDDAGARLELDPRGADAPLELLPSQGPGSAVESVVPNQTVTPVDELLFFGSEMAAATSSASSDDEDAELDDDGLERWEELRNRFLSSDELDQLPDPTYLVKGVFQTDTLVRVVGFPGHGKSFFMLDIAACVATGRAWHGHEVEQGLVVYMVAEGVRGWKKRLRAWEQENNGGRRIPREQLMIIPFAVQTNDKEAWRDLRRALHSLHPHLVIFDTQARITVGVDENGATDMGIVIERLELMRVENAGCTVALVHHLGHVGSHGRGTSAVLGALHTELRVIKKGPQVTIHCDKQKDDDEFEPKVVTFRRVELGLDDKGDPMDSAVLEMLIDDAMDPLDADCLVDLKSPLWQRMAKTVYQVFQHAPRGGTKAEIKAVVFAVEQEEKGHTPTRQSFEKAYGTLDKKGLIQLETEDGKKLGFRIRDDLVEELGFEGLNPMVNPLKKDVGRHLELVLDDDDE